MSSRAANLSIQSSITYHHYLVLILMSIDYSSCFIMCLFWQWTSDIHNMTGIIITAWPNIFLYRFPLTCDINWWFIHYCCMFVTFPLIHFIQASWLRKAFWADSAHLAGDADTKLQSQPGFHEYAKKVRKECRLFMGYISSQNHLLGGISPKSICANVAIFPK